MALEGSVCVFPCPLQRSFRALFLRWLPAICADSRLKGFTICTGGTMDFRSKGLEPTVGCGFKIENCILLDHSSKLTQTPSKTLVRSQIRMATDSCQKPKKHTPSKKSKRLLPKKKNSSYIDSFQNTRMETDSFRKNKTDSFQKQTKKTPLTQSPSKTLVRSQIRMETDSFQRTKTDSFEPDSFQNVWKHTPSKKKKQGEKKNRLL